MCGVYGMVSRSFSKGRLTSRLSEMGRIQRHRGPDDKKEVVFSLSPGYLGMGLVRLSILDLDTGMQPIICPQDGTAIACNGQIYNYLELKPSVAAEPFVSRGDIEVALHLYRLYGLDFLQHLNGMYAGVIYAPAQNRLLLFRDRFGIKPLYYMEVDGAFLFASEINPLLTGSGRPAHLNMEGLATFFTYRYLPGESTMFQGIKRLPPGSFMIYDLTTGRHSITRYWEYQPDNVNHNLSLKAAAEEFFHLISDAVRIRLRADVEVGALLSGGIDSSTVAALAADVRPDIRLFTISFQEDKYNELPEVDQFLAANPQRFASARWHVRSCGRDVLEGLPGIVRSLEEPISLAAVLPTDQVCALAGEQLKVVLTGEGADEIFAGYRKFLVESAAGLYPSLSVERQKALIAAYPELTGYLKVRHPDPVARYIQSERLFSTDELGALLGKPTVSGSFPADARPTLSGREDPLNMVIAMECRARLPDYIILRLDKLSMRHSLETRTPFLDHRLAEFAATLPPRFKADPELGLEKRICSYASQKFGVIDALTAQRKKQPFTIPLADWLVEPGQLPDLLQEIIRGDMIEQQGILNPEMIRQDLDHISVPDTGPETLVSAADRVFSIILFTLWYENFFGDSAKSPG